MLLDLAAVDASLTTSRFGRRIIYETVCDSTMDVARREAEAGAGEGTAVIAEEQTRGRGRFGRSWVSPSGKNLYLTLIARPPVERLRALSMAAPLAVSLAVEEAAGLRTAIKWPNDVVVGGRKLAGVLIENELSGSEVRFALVGAGINVNLDIEQSPEIAAIATSVLRKTGREVSRERVLASFFGRFEDLYDSPLPALVASWRERLETLGREVTVTLRGETFEGTAEDVDDSGNLVLRRPDGSAMTFEAGEVSLRAPE